MLCQDFHPDGDQDQAPRQGGPPLEETTQLPAHQPAQHREQVMNTQRGIIYKQRHQVLDGEDLQNSIQNMIRSMVGSAIQGHMGEQKHMDAEEFQEAVSHFRTMFLGPNDLLLSDEELKGYDAEGLTQLVLDKALAAYQNKEREITPPLMRELERVIMLRVVDEYWMDHIDAMTELRQGIGLRAYGQSDPVVAYKEEGYEMFESMVAAIQEETLRRLFLVRLRQNEPVKRERVAKVTSESSAGDGAVRKQPVKKVVKIGRNDPCPCGSGLKWKKCTCPQYHPELK